MPASYACTAAANCFEMGFGAGVTLGTALFESVRDATFRMADPTWLLALVIGFLTLWDRAGGEGLLVEATLEVLAFVVDLAFVAGLAFFAFLTFPLD